MKRNYFWTIAVFTIICSVVFFASTGYNLANNAKYQTICRDLETQLLTDWDPIEIEKQVRESQKARILIEEVAKGQWRQRKQ